jgi:hypothetical protein
MKPRPVIPAEAKPAGVVDYDKRGEGEKEQGDGDANHAAATKEQWDVVSRPGHETRSSPFRFTRQQLVILSAAKDLQPERAPRSRDPSLRSG